MQQLSPKARIQEWLSHPITKAFRIALDGLVARENSELLNLPDDCPRGQVDRKIGKVKAIIEIADLESFLEGELEDDKDY